MKGFTGFFRSLRLKRAATLRASAAALLFALAGCMESSQTLGPASTPVSATTLDSSRSTVRTGNTTVPADGTSLATISVLLYDGTGTLMAGKSVTLSSSRGALDTITPTVATTNSNGIAIFRVKSTRAGSPVFTATEVATGSSPAVTATVTFTPLPFSRANSTVTATSSFGVTNGTPIPVTVTILDSRGNPLAGHTVTLASNRPGFDTITNPASLVSGDDGRVVFTVSTNTAGPSVYTATASGLTLTQTVSISYSLATIGLSFDKTALSATFPASDTATVTVTNTDTLITATSISVAGVSSPLSVSSSTCGATLAPGASCVIVLVFDAPGALSQTQTFQVNYDNGLVATSVSQAVTLTGISGVFTVDPVYAAAPNWNDYVVRSGADLLAATGTACTGTESGITPCFHAGDKRKFVIAGRSSCSGLTISDTLGLFNWECRASGGTTTFYSTGLKDNKGLADLVNATGWKSNAVIVMNGAYLAAASAMTAWWSNSVQALADNSGGADPVVSLSSSGTIYTLAASRVTRGYAITADKVGLVTLGTATLGNGGGATVNCKVPSTEATDNLWCMVHALGRKHLWIEGRFDGYNAAQSGDFNVALESTGFSRIHNVSSASTLQYGLLLWSTSNHNLVTQYRSHNGDSGLRVDGGPDGSDGTLGSRFNIFSGLNIASTSQNALQNYGLDNTFTRVIVSGSDATAIEDASGDSTWSHVTVANSVGSVTAGLFSTFVQLVAAYTSTGIQSSVDSTWSQIYSAASAGPIALTGGAATFRDSLLLGSTGCTVSGGATGLVNGTCAAQAPSSATVTVNVQASNSFVDKVGTDDAANSSDTLGSAAFSLSAMDFFGFDNFFRSWGLDQSAFPISTNYGQCASGNCRIWDWRLKSSDAVLRAVNGTFTAGAACPASASGSRVITNQQSTASVFLVNALEIIGDASGNENGLCESNEACVFSPNFGAYQGEGDYRSAGSCTFQDGTVTGVTLYGYPTNGG